MKKVLTVLFAAMLAFPALAQGKFGADSAECVKYLSYYTEYLKQKNEDAAIGPWREAYSRCPVTASYNMLKDGQKLMRGAYKKTKDSKVRQGYVDTIMKIYDQRVEFYPKDIVNTMNNKAIDMNQYGWKKKEPKEAYALYKEIFEATGSKALDLVYVKLMELSTNLFSESELGAEQVMADYTAITEAINASLAAKDDQKMRKAQKDVETMFMNCGIASCDNLLELLTPRYEANPDDEETLRAVVKMLSSADCLDSDLYLKAVEALYAKDPSSSTAYLLYKLYARKDDSAGAVKFLNEAINTSDGSDVAQLASYYMELGTYNYKKAGNNAAAVAAAKKAAELSADYKGRAYLLIGTIWGTTRCGGNEIQSKANFWVAYDYVTRAKAADASLTSEANALAAQYQAYFPGQADAFMYDLTNGQSYTVSCGSLTETTTVRTAK
ncbi:MAG: hypothetical protein J6X89_04655 [Bacteroidales bacterium]|nr:hypothetical protein [Bacteroidales bacterium]